MPRRCLGPFFCLIVIWFSLCLLAPLSTFGHSLDTDQSIGIDERIGETITPDIVLSDEEGRATVLGDLIRKPTILVLVYYTCGRFCPQVLAGLAAALPDVRLVADQEYQVITVSFDETDTPATARHLKRNYLKAMERPFPADAWRFLTGSRENIKELCDAVGFTFRKEMHGFAHPVALIILSPSRKITRYIHVSKFSYGVAYPITFSAVDLSQVLTDASRGKIGAATHKEFLYCFPHEPEGQQRFFHVLMLIGAGTVIALVAFFVYLSLNRRKRQEGKRS